MPDILPIETVLRNLGKELKDLREKAGLSQEEVASVLGYGRGTGSKHEMGERQISLYDYLILMDFYRDIAPDHPGVELARRMLGRRSRKTTA